MTMLNRSRDWLRQAIHDLEPAEESRQAGRYDWACFAAYSQKPFLSRATDFNTSRLPVPSDLLVYTQDEWEAMERSGRCKGRRAKVRWLYERGEKR